MSPFLRAVTVLAAWGLAVGAYNGAALAGWVERNPIVETVLWIATALVILGVLAAVLKIFPYRPLVWIGSLPFFVSLGLFAGQEAFGPLLAVDAALVLIALADLTTLPRGRALACERHCGRIVSLQQNHRVTLSIANQSRRAQAVWVRDAAPPELHAQPDEFFLRLAGRSRAIVHYHVKSTRRGAFTLPSVHLRARSRLGLWQRFFNCRVESVLHVYPDMKQLAEYAVLARKDRLTLLGVRRTRRIGQDNEFERLRDYTLDDNYKHIEWRTTARRRKLTVKDFQSNQSQRLVFLIDCGRMMTNEAAGLSLLDHALNSMLMLSYVALARGDAVGLMCFSDEIHGFVPPRAGMQQMNRLLHAAFDRFPRLVESRYDEAFLYLSRSHRKRSLVVLVTNLIDEVNSNQVERYLGTLVGRHLPLGVLLRDRRIFEAADARDPQGADLFRAAAAAEILTWRHQVLADLQAKGVLSLDVFPEDLTAPLINRYLEIKARHLL